MTSNDMIQTEFNLLPISVYKEITAHAERWSITLPEKIMLLSKNNLEGSSSVAAKQNVTVLSYLSSARHGIKAIGSKSLYYLTETLPKSGTLLIKRTILKTRTLLEGGALYCASCARCAIRNSLELIRYAHYLINVTKGALLL